MASVQCQKPSEQVQPSTNYQKTTTTETCYCKKNNTTVNHNEKHSFTEKVKEMAHSAQKMFNHQSPVPNHAQKPATNNSSTGGGGVKTEKKKKVITKKTEGQDGHCMPKMLDHMKNKKTKKNKNKDEKKHGGGSSDSGSSSESEDDKCKVKN